MSGGCPPVRAFRRAVAAAILLGVAVPAGDPGGIAAAEERVPADAASLLKDLRAAPSAEARREALWRLWTLGPAAVTAAEEIHRVAERDPPLAWDAAFALAALGGEGVERLGKDLFSDDEGRRLLAARALVYAGPGAAAALGAVTTALEHRDSAVRDAALPVLASLGEAALPAAPKVARILATTPGRRPAAAEALRAMGPGALSAVVPVLGHDDPEARAAACAVVGEWGEGAAPAAGALVAVLRDRDPAVRLAALRAVAGVGPAAREGIPALRNLLRDRDDEVRREAGRALGAMGPAASDCVLAVAGLLKDKDPLLRVVGADALGAIGPGPGNPVGLLVRALRDDDLRVRLAAVRALARMGPDALDAADALARVAEQDGLERIRAEALVARSSVTTPREAPSGDAVPRAERWRPPAPYRVRMDPLLRSVAAERFGLAGAEEAVERGLEWLAAHQCDDGRWSTTVFAAKCGDAGCAGQGGPYYDIGVTGLALLAFLGNGETPSSRRHGATVRAGLDYLLSQADDQGCFGRRLSTHFVYNHALATLALAEARALTGDETLRRAAQGGVDYIMRIRNPGGGWRYGVRPGDSDTSVTSWMAEALGMAAVSGFRTDPGMLPDVLRWLDRLTEPRFGRTGYTAIGNGPARPEEFLDAFPPDGSEANTACALVVRYWAGQDPARSRYARLGVQIVLRVPPAWNRRKGTIDLYYWQHAAFALARWGGKEVLPWFAALREALVPRQVAEGHAAGSWDPVDPWGTDGGRVYSTAMAVLALEAPWRCAGSPAGE